MIKPILYSFRRCPYAMRARFALMMCAVNYEHREIIFRNKPQPMLDISPKGTVPVLQLANNDVLEESLDIMLWAFESSGKGVTLSAEENKLIRQNDTTFKEGLDRYKYPTRYEGDDDVLRQKGYQSCLQFLGELESFLTQNIYLFGAKIGFADIAIFPFIRQFSKVDEKAWQQNEFPLLRAWLQTLCATSIFEQAMQKHPLYIPKS